MAKIKLSSQAELIYKNLYSTNRDTYTYIDRALDKLRSDKAIGVSLKGALQGKYS